MMLFDKESDMAMMSRTRMGILRQKKTKPLSLEMCMNLSDLLPLLPVILKPWIQRMNAPKTRASLKVTRILWAFQAC